MARAQWVERLSGNSRLTTCSGLGLLDVVGRLADVRHSSGHPLLSEKLPVECCVDAAKPC